MKYLLQLVCSEHEDVRVLREGLRGSQVSDTLEMDFG